MTHTDGQDWVAGCWVLVLVVVVVVDTEAPHLDRVSRVSMVPLHHAVLVVDDGRGLAPGHLRKWNNILDRYML